MLGFVFGCVALGGWLLAAGFATLPAWNWTLPQDGADLGAWHVDGTLEAFAAMPLAIPIALLTIGLVRIMAAAEAGLAEGLLGSDDADMPTAAHAVRRRRPRGAATTPTWGCRCTSRSPR